MLLASHRPKVVMDSYFRDTLKSRLLESSQGKTTKSIPFSWRSLFPVFGTAFACLLFGISFWKVFFPNGELLLDPHDESLRTLQENKMSSITGEVTKSQTNTLAENKIQEFRAEKTSIDKEIQGIVDDMNSMDLSTSPLEDRDSASANREVSPYADASPPPSDAPTMAMMTMSTPEPSYIIPEYATTMRLYAKSDMWASEEILTRSGSGIIVRDTPTEKRSIIESKVAKLLEGKNIISAIVDYQLMQKIAVDPDKLFYLLPVLEYTTDTGEKIRISLIRGFR